MNGEMSSTRQATNKVDLRIGTMKNQKEETKQLFDLLKEYHKLYTALLETQRKILRNIKKFYGEESLYSNLIEKVRKVIQTKECDISESLIKLEQEIKHKEPLNTQIYAPLQDFSSKYYEKLKVYEYYDKKLPKLEETRTKKEVKGKVKPKDIERVERNKKKYKDAVLGAKSFAKNFIDWSNITNLERFKVINPVIKHFVDIEISNFFVIEGNIVELENFGQIFDMQENNFYNDKYFKDELEGSNLELRSYVNTNQSSKKVFNKQDEESVEYLELEDKKVNGSKDGSNINLSGV